MAHARRTFKSGVAAKVAMGVLILILLLLSLVKYRYGGGEAFPQQYYAGPVLAPEQVEVVAELDSPPGNIAVSADARIFVTLHPEAKPDWKVVELVQGKPVPFPSEAFQAGGAIGFHDVLSIRIDQQNRLWALDNGGHGVQPGRLLAFDLDSKALVHEYVFPRDVAGFGSHLNDFQVSADGKWVYIADASFFRLDPSVIAYSVEQKQAYRRIYRHPSVEAQPYIPVVEGRRLELYGLVSVRPGVDSIALSRDGQTLYFAPIASDTLYAIATQQLTDLSIAPEVLQNHVREVSKKPLTSGMSSDEAGNLYLAAIERSGLMRYSNKTGMTTFVQAPEIGFADGLSFGPDGWLYIASSNLHKILALGSNAVTEHAPYYVFRVPTEENATPGH